MGLGNLVKSLVPVGLTAVSGGSAGAIFSSLVASQESAKQQNRIKNQVRAYNQSIEEELRMAEIFGTGNVTTIQPQLQGSSVNRSGFGAGFGEFLGDFGRNILNPLGQIFSTGKRVLGMPSDVLQPATTRPPVIQGGELQSTGTNEAFIGSIPNIIGQAGRFLRSPVGQIGTGVGVTTALMGNQSMPRSTRITRKTKRLAKQAYSLAFGDLSTATVLFAQLSGLQVNEQQFVLILTKTFRNDGPVITKAALRKTKTTLRRMKNMCDMYDSLKKAPTRRRTPMKRATTTLISNK